MEYKSIYSKPLLTCFLFLFILPLSHAQTKKIKRPKSSVGISSVDNFVRESFDIYDKVYKCDGYAAAGTPLDDEDIDVLEEALEDLSILSDSAPDILSDLDGQNVLKQGKATLQINRAKKALKYSIKTAKELLLGERKRKEEKDNKTDTSEDSDNNSSSTEDSGNTKDTNNSEEEANSNISDNLEILSKYDFVPGDKLLFFDDFSQDFIGDFPSKWNTNGSGEVVKTNKAEGNWFQLKSGYGIKYLPLIDDKLPEEYTIEFDILTKGVGSPTSSTARLYIVLDDNNGFSDGRTNALVTIPFGQYGAFGIQVRNTDPSDKKINATLTADIRKAVINKPHISIAVNKKRFRLWVNEKKYVDIPQLIYDPASIGYLKFNLYGFKDGEEFIFIQNLKIAEGGVDLRRKLLSEGKISTNGILFDSGSSNIQTQSYGIIRQISQVLMQDESIKLKIVGHTDSDGGDNTNMALSKARAEAVKQALVKVYKIDKSRLISDGKGESEPVGDNSTTEGKAQNRRVEFIKQ
ncbi:OmpA family protein [uncultured Psychroserpens sp.]|uniref:OmpA family protein n=1 Tax=uncultured Psychroserpens sp. TaxID=255436 RepID=UPI00261B3349|nr:OmpA family protein [uncultured Psychroserpens sp.]